MERIGIIGKGLAGVITGLIWKTHLPECEVTIYHDGSPIEPVGSGSWPNILRLLNEVGWYHPKHWMTWDRMDFDQTPKTGILYEGWGYNHRWFHDFGISEYAMHFDPEAFTNYWCKSGLFNVVEEHVTPDDLMDDWIYDCSGTPDNFDNYYTLENPLDSVVLGNTLPIKSEVTRAVATPDGWCFEIPLRSSTTYGYLYSTTTTKDEVAVKNFRNLFKVAETKTRRFKNYCAKMPVVSDRVFLNGNKYFFIEPLEATSITGYMYWVDSTIEYIRGKQTKEQIVSDNLEMIQQNSNFLLYHYQYGSKYNSPFWDYAKTLTVNDSEFWNLIGDSFRGDWKAKLNNKYSYFNHHSVIMAHYNLIGNNFEDMLKTKLNK